MRVQHTFRSIFYICFLLLPILTNCNCDPTELGSASELIAIPKILTFDATEGKKLTKKVVIQSKLGDIQITEISLYKGAPHYKLDQASLPKFPTILKQGETLTLSVTYTAPAGTAIAGIIRVENDAATPKEGYLDVPLISQRNQQLLAFEANPVNFGLVKQGKSKELEIVGKNEGRAVLKIQKIGWDKKANKGFTIIGNLPKLPLSLESGQTFKFKVKYEPTTAKQDRASMFFTCEGNCAPGSKEKNLQKDPYELRFVGQQSAALIEVEPLKIDFGYVESGAEKTEKIKITNRGSAPLIISKISMKAKSSGSFIVARLIDVEIGPGKSKELPVIFRPTTGVNHEGTIEIHNNDPSKPLVEVLLFGKVSAPDIDVLPMTLDFGSVNTTKEMTFTISNLGIRELVIKTIQMMPGTSTEFTFKATPVMPLRLNPGQSKKFKVIYTPANKNDDSGKILITSNDPDESKVEVLLKAKGSLLPQCDLVGTPARVNFGTGVLGQTKILPVKWTNQGGADCEISAFTVTTDRTGFPPYSGPDVYHLPNAPKGCQVGAGRYTCKPALVIKPQNSLTLQVGFTPVTEKKANPFSAPNFTGSLDATTNAKPSTRRIILDGIGKAPCLVAAPDTLDFGLVTVGCSSQKEKIVLYNICSDKVEIKKVGFSTAGANGFRITKAPQTPFTIAGNQSVEIELAYKSVAPPKKQHAVLLIENNLSHQNPMSIPMIAEGTTTSEQTDTFKQTKGGKVDILFVIDNSGSMGNEQKNLASNFSSFIKWASTLKVDFQLGITTTTVKSSPFQQFKAGELVGNPPILTPNTPNYITAFSQHARVGTTGSASEMGLEAAKLALSAPNITTGRNKGFLRKDASLSIVTVSDEADVSNLPIQAYINFFKSLKGIRNQNLIRYNIVIGIDEKTLANKCPNGAAASAGRYLAVAQAFRGIVASICNANWSSTLGRIGSVTFGLKSQFFLSRAADPKSITVKVDGKPVANGATTWTYSANDNSITFKQVPVQGATIQVRYKAICF